ncbi:SDR family oxidoreductase [Rufibacter sp. LB8]|uniref:SDR family oxidoreductase n=1 Tax=Rufibacter sp. LB8 TaxID=2777781 RepID=UPI00178C2A5C|nr:SDR family oxidoreductase [Rufibacter sp. LB8]
MTHPDKEKIIIITGASSGLGKAATEALARQGALVAMVCRNREKGEKAITDIKSKVPHANLQLHLADLSSLDQVRALAQELQAAYPVIDVLINNAGLIPGLQQTTIEGYEVSWVTNHLAPFLLTNLLMDNLLKAQQGRVITVSSEAHRIGKIDFDNAGNPQHYSAVTAYADSKLANILFTYELARRSEFTSLTVNTLHPGVVATNFGSNSSIFIRLIYKLGKLFMKSAANGAQTMVYLATSPEVEAITGKYFKNSQPRPSSADSCNAHIARRLWELSAEQTGF